MLDSILDSLTDVLKDLLTKRWVTPSWEGNDDHVL